MNTTDGLECWRPKKCLMSWGLVIHISALFLHLNMMPKTLKALNISNFLMFQHLQIKRLPAPGLEATPPAPHKNLKDFGGVCSINII